MQTNMRTDELEVKQWKTRRKGAISIWDPKIIRGAIPDVVQETGSSCAGQEPGDVRGGGGQRDHHYRVCAPALHAAKRELHAQRAYVRDDLRAGGGHLVVVHGGLRELR